MSTTDVDELVRRGAEKTARVLDRRRLLHRAAEGVFMGAVLYAARGPSVASADVKLTLTSGQCSQPTGCGCPARCGPSPCCVACSSLCTCNSTTCTGGCTPYEDWGSLGSCWSCTESSGCTTTVCCDCHTTTSTHCICSHVSRSCVVTADGKVEALVNGPEVIWENGGPLNPPRPLYPGVNNLRTPHMH